MSSNKSKGKKTLDLIIDNRSVYSKSLTPYQFFLKDLYIVSSEKTKEWNLAFSCSQELLAFLSFIVTAMASNDISNQIKRAISSLNVPNDIKNMAFINERIAFYLDVFSGKTHPEHQMPSVNTTSPARSSKFKRDKVLPFTLLGAIADKEFERSVMSDPFSRTFIAFGNIVFQKNQSIFNRNAVQFKHSFPTLFLQFPPFISECISISGLSVDNNEATTSNSNNEHLPTTSSEPFGELFGFLFIFISQQFKSLELKGDAKSETLSFLYSIFDYMAFKTGKDRDRLWNEITSCIESIFPDENHQALYEKMDERAVLYANIINHQIRPNNGYYIANNEEHRHIFEYAWFAYGGILKDPSSADKLLNRNSPTTIRPIQDIVAFTPTWLSIFQAVIGEVHKSRLFYNN